MRTGAASVLSVLLVARAAQGFVLPAPRSRPALLSLSMNKALQRPGQASADAKTIAIIGGGISGLVCARRLKELGLSPTVFDTGKRGVGGLPSIKDNMSLPVLVFALTPKEIARVQAEPVLQMPMKTDTELDKQWGCWHAPSHRGRVL